MILSKVRRELSAASDEGKRQAGLRYFREEVNLYGISANTVKQIARENFFRTGMTWYRRVMAGC